MSEQSGPRPWSKALKLIASVAVLVVFAGLIVLGVRGGGQDVPAGPARSGVSALTSMQVPGGAAAGARTLKVSPGPTLSLTPKARRAIKLKARRLARAVERNVRLESSTQPAPAPTPAPLPDTDFTVASFNLLGASHTQQGGNKTGYAAGPTRMRWAVSLLRNAGVDVVGFGEFEDPQYRAFMAATGGQYGVFPGPTLDRGSIRQSIAWRQDTWALVDAESIAIPYFHGQRIRMPYVLLRNLATGREVWFINVHNPATTPRWGNNERWRDAATALEISLVNRLQAQTGQPVVLTGDFNERDEVFCKVTGQAAVVAANGGEAGEARCITPPSMDVDWIFGSDYLTFSGFVSQRRGLVQRTSDHPMVYSRVSVPPVAPDPTGPVDGPVPSKR